ncbi:MAG: creatininase family protein [Gemmatimonadota bacterium]|jgi:creatinine amidohydrolase
MRIREMTWMDVARYLEGDDRVVLPTGSTEQHAYLSLATDALLAERVAVEAADPLGVPVYPVVPYGVAPYFAAYPGTVTLAEGTYVALLRDVLESLVRSGFRRILVVNGHGGNRAAVDAVAAWAGEREGVALRWHDWWKAPATKAEVDRIDPTGSHANWMESFPWTRVRGAPVPAGGKAAPDLSDRATLSPAGMRERLGDGSFGGPYRRSDREMERIWEVAVRETRARLVGEWSGGRGDET